MRKYFKLYYISRLVFPVAVFLLVLHAFHSKTPWSQDVYYISAGNFVLLVLVLSEIRHLYRIVLAKDDNNRLYPTKPIYNKDMLPGEVNEWSKYQRVEDKPIPAQHIAEPFNVETAEGVVGCKDGYITLDPDGVPYPIAAAVFEHVFEPAEPSDSETA